MSSPSASRRVSPISADGSSQRKRRYVEEQASLSFTSSEYQSTGRDGIEVHEVDSDGKFIRIFNSSDKVDFRNFVNLIG